MRTTLNIDDDVLEKVRRIAKAQGKSMEKVISELVRVVLERDGVLPLRSSAPNAGELHQTRN
jgi:hypothetical protein